MEPKDTTLCQMAGFDLLWRWGDGVSGEKQGIYVTKTLRSGGGGTVWAQDPEWEGMRGAINTGAGALTLPAGELGQGTCLMSEQAY